MKNIFVCCIGVCTVYQTGGLADVVGSLPKDFDKEKYDVRVVIPNYMCMKQEWKEKLEYVAHFYMDIAGQDRYVGVLKIELNGIISILSIMNIISVDLLRMMGIRSGI